MAGPLNLPALGGPQPGSPGTVRVNGQLVAARPANPGRIFGPQGQQIGVRETLLSGFSNVTLLGPALVKPVLRQFGIGDRQLDEWHRLAQADPTMRWMELGAEWIPEFAVGAGAWAVGRKLMVAGLARVAPQLLKALGQGGKSAEEISLRFAELVARDQTGKVSAALGGPLEKQLADTLRLVGRVAGTTNFEVPTPALLRAAEIVGGGLAGGVLGATDALLEGKPLNEVARTGATWAAWSIVPEAGLTVGLKSVSKHFRANDPRVIELRALMNEPLQNAKMDAKTQFAGRVGTAATRMQGLLDTIDEAQQIIAGVAGVQAHIATNNVQAVGAAWARMVSKGQKPVMTPTQAPSLSTIQREALEVVEATKGKLPGAAREVAASKAAQQALDRTTHEERTWRAHYLGTEATGPRTRGKIGLVKTLEEAYHRMMSRTAESPQSAFKRFGTQSAMLGHLVELSEVQSSQMQAVKTNLAHRALEHVRRGWDPGKVSQGGKFTLRAFHDRQKLGGTKAAMVAATDVRDTKLVAQGIDELARNKQLTVNQMVRQGIVERGVVGDQPPVLPRPDLSDDAFQEQWVQGLIKLTGISREQSVVATNAALRRYGHPRFGDGSGAPVKRGILSFSEDVFEETLPPGTTLMEAVEAGLPVVDDPVAAYLMWERSAQRRLAHNKYFGPNYEVLEHLKEGVNLEGGYTSITSELADAVLGRTYEQIADRRFASLVTNINVASRMTLGVIPQVTQLAASGPLVHGMTNTMLGVTRLAKFGDSKLQAAVQGETRGMADTLVRNWREAALDPNFHTPGGKMADAVFHFSGFNAVERVNRMGAAQIAKTDLARTVVQAVEGRLRGRNFEEAARRMDRLKVPLDHVVQQVRRLTTKGTPTDEAIAKVLLRNDGELLTRAGWRGAQQDVFLSERSARPTAWNTPTGRVLTQFKNFAFQQAKLVRDAVLKEAVTYGNMQPLAYFMSVYPVAGEFVGDVRSLFGPEDNWGRPDKSGFERVFNNTMAVGGFGIVSDMMVQAGYGRFGEALLGPTGGDLVSFVNNTFTGKHERTLQSIQRLPAYRFVQGVGLLGAGGLEQAIEAVRAGQEYLGGEPESGITLDELRTLETQ